MSGQYSLTYKIDAIIAFTTSTASAGIETAAIAAPFSTATVAPWWAESLLDVQRAATAFLINSRCLSF